MIADGQMVKVQMNLFQVPAASFLLFKDGHAVAGINPALPLVKC